MQPGRGAGTGKQRRLVSPLAEVLVCRGSPLRDTQSQAPVTNPRLASVLAELHQREPVFHRAEFGTTRRDFENMTDENFLEVGASGRRYSRQYVIDTLAERHQTPQHDVWEASEFHCTELGPGTYLVTYTLLQDRSRLTRRASIWRKSGGAWKILYHQGTLVATP